jgi:hypothetical protein
VDAALREDPGFTLPPGFADRVALGVLQSRRRFHWFEHVILPMLLVLPIFFLFGAMGSAEEGLRSGVQGTLLHALALFPKLPVDGVLYAGACLLFSAAADRVLGRRMRERTVRLVA